jgi:hypothetical protein
MYIAKDVAESINVSNTTCLVIKNADGKVPTQFQRFLAASVRSQLLLHQRVVYSTPPIGTVCEMVEIEVNVIPHSGPTAHPYPGQFTLLASGVVVARHVARAFSEASTVGAVALAESGWWATSGFRTGNDVSEVAVAISRTNAGQYLGQYVNVYYVASGDAALYDASNSSPSFEVSPDYIEPCQRPEFVVSGDHLARQKEGYYLGSLQASAVSHNEAGPDGPVTVTFQPAKHWASQRDQVTLTMVGSDNLVRKAYLYAGSTGGNCLDSTRTADFKVSPTEISACAEHAEFRVSGKSLSLSPKDYLLGVVPASKAEPPIRGDSGESVAVNFAGLSSSNRGQDRIEFSMAAPDGSTRSAYIRVEGGAPASCAATKTATNAVGTKPKVPTIVLAPVGGQPADQLDVCVAPPLKMVATGEGPASIQAVNILGGEYPGGIETRVDGKSTSVTLTFTKYPDFRNAIPSTDTLDVNLILAPPKSGRSKTVTKVTIKRAVKCGA